MKKKMKNIKTTIDRVLFRDLGVRETIYKSLVTQLKIDYADIDDIDIEFATNEVNDKIEITAFKVEKKKEIKESDRLKD